jgi:hypothetical protein
LVFSEETTLSAYQKCSIVVKCDCVWSHFNWFREFAVTYSFRAIKPDIFEPSSDSCGVKSRCVFHVIQLSYNGYTWLFPLHRDLLHLPSMIIVHVSIYSFTELLDTFLYHLLLFEKIGCYLAFALGFIIHQIITILC